MRHDSLCPFRIEPQHPTTSVSELRLRPWRTGETVWILHPCDRSQIRETASERGSQGWHRFAVSAVKSGEPVGCMSCVTDGVGANPVSGFVSALAAPGERSERRRPTVVASVFTRVAKRLVSPSGRRVVAASLRLSCLRNRVAVVDPCRVQGQTQAGRYGLDPTCAQVLAFRGSGARA